MKNRHLLAAMSLLVIGVFGYAVLDPAPSRRPVVTVTTGGPAASAPNFPAPALTAPAAAYDLAHLIHPPKRYLGVAIPGAPRDMSRIDAFAGRIGVKPNAVMLYESFDDPFAAAEVRAIYRYGALPIVRWEPFTQKLGDIAAGRHDEYLLTFADAVRTLDVPIALTLAHEMNGRWYPWGARTTTPTEFVAAWRHVHDLFARTGATKVIWTWTPNVINDLRRTPLKPYWPGPDYVDWIGMDGYFTYEGQTTFETLFRPTLDEVTALSGKPVFIVETGAEPGSMRARAVAELFGKVAADKNLVGFVYFNARGSHDWVLDYDRRALTVFRTDPNRAAFTFTVH